MKEWIAVLKAADAAARWHVHQRRKGAAEEPYVNHLLEVASLVAEATDGKDPELVIAALLHDAIEDQEVPRGHDRRGLGRRGRQARRGGHGRQGTAKEDRKRKQVESASKKSDRAKSSSSPTRRATFERSPPARQRSGPSSVGSNMWPGLVTWLTAYAARTHGLRPSLIKQPKRPRGR